jgi:hypothetical protein
MASRDEATDDLLGHKTLARTLRYAHLAPERLCAAVATLDGCFRSPMGARREQEKRCGRTSSASLSRNYWSRLG